LHSFFQIETDQNGRLLFSSAAMRVRIPPRVHPAIHPGPKWSTALQQYHDEGANPPALTLDRNGASQPVAKLFLAHALASSIDSDAVALGRSSFSQNHSGPLPEFFCLGKWAKQRCTETKVPWIRSGRLVCFFGFWYFCNSRRLRI
jgi:hypothetical protein